MTTALGIFLRGGAVAGALVAITTVGNYMVVAAPWESKTEAQSSATEIEKHIDTLSSHTEKLQQQADQQSGLLLQLQRAYWLGQKETADGELGKNPRSVAAMRLRDLAQSQIDNMDQQSQKEH